MIAEVVIFTWSKRLGLTKQFLSQGPGAHKLHDALQDGAPVLLIFLLNDKYFFFATQAEHRHG